MSRRYTVTSWAGAHAPSVAAFADAELALDHFENLLHVSGHTDPVVRQHLSTFTAALMKGTHGFTVMDPDLNGAVEISISTK